MYRNAYQRGMLTVFFSVGSKPLAIWDVVTQDGYVSRFLDQDIKSMVLEIGGSNVSTTYITCPKGNMVLGISMPFLVMIVKNLKKYFSFEVTILDETGTRRRFRVSNFQSSTQILPMCTVMPIGLSDGWNQIQFNLAEFTRRAYKKQYVEVQRLKINANIRLRRIYFTERLIPEDELPAEYKLFFPLISKGKGKQAQADKKATASQQAIKSATKMETKADEAKGSKTSIHSIKKAPSQQSRKDSKAGAEAAPPVEEKDDKDTQATTENVTEGTEATEPAAETELPVTPEATEEKEPTEAGEAPAEAEAQEAAPAEEGPPPEEGAPEAAPAEGEPPAEDPAPE